MNLHLRAAINNCLIKTKNKIVFAFDLKFLPDVLSFDAGFLISVILKTSSLYLKENAEALQVFAPRLNLIYQYSIHNYILMTLISRGSRRKYNDSCVCVFLFVYGSPLLTTYKNICYRYKYMCYMYITISVSIVA